MMSFLETTGFQSIPDFCLHNATKLNLNTKGHPYQSSLLYLSGPGGISFADRLLTREGNRSRAANRCLRLSQKTKT